jgi:hypothetical protein
MFSSSGVHSPESPISESWAETTSFLNQTTTENADYGAVNGEINIGSADANQEAPAVVGQAEEEAAEEETSASDEGEDTRDGAIGTLTRRLRCLFSTITWPIVPLGTIVVLALLWVLYAASSLDLRRTCSHPLHWYALSSLILVAYIPHHAQVRSHLFQYVRERVLPEFECTISSSIPSVSCMSTRV